MKKGDKVLVRDSKNSTWIEAIFIKVYDKDRYKTSEGIYNYCLPYTTPIIYL